MKKISRYFFVFLTLFPLLFSSHALASGKKVCTTNSTQDESYASQFLAFCLEQIPTKKEFMSDLTYVTPLEFIVNQFIDMGGPTGKSVLRDLTKIPATYDKVAKNASVGGTPYVFDESNIWSQYTKVGIKVGFVCVGWALGVPAKVSAPLSNYPGDIVSRALVKSGMDKQNLKDEQEFSCYLLENFGTQWVWWLVEGVTEAVPKVLAMQVVSKVLFNSYVSPIVGTIAFAIPNYFLESAFSGETEVQTDKGSVIVPTTIAMNVAAHMLARNNAGPGYSSLIYTGATVGALGFSYLMQSVSPFVLAFPARFIQNGVDKVFKKVSSEVEKMASASAFFISPFSSNGSPFFIWPL